MTKRETPIVSTTKVERRYQMQKQGQDWILPGNDGELTFFISSWYDPEDNNRRIWWWEVAAWDEYYGEWIPDQITHDDFRTRDEAIQDALAYEAALQAPPPIGGQR